MDFVWLPWTRIRQGPSPADPHASASFLSLSDRSLLICSEWTRPSPSAQVGPWITAIISACRKRVLQNSNPFFLPSTFVPPSRRKKPKVTVLPRCAHYSGESVYPRERVFCSFPPIDVPPLPFVVLRKKEKDTFLPSLLPGRNEAEPHQGVVALSSVTSSSLSFNIVCLMMNVRSGFLPPPPPPFFLRSLQSNLPGYFHPLYSCLFEELY